MNNKVVEITVEGAGSRCNFCSKTQIDSLMWGPTLSFQGVTVHYFCMLFSAGLSQDGKDDEGIFGFMPKDIKKELSRGKKLKCRYCKKTGATVGCSVKSCKRSFHYPCGLDKGSLYQFINNFESFCVDHKKIPNIKIHKEKWADCPICYTSCKDDAFPVKPPCCGGTNNAVFHRKCLMETAKNSGLHFFKCPLCNDKNAFSEAMRLQGIYVPDRDAAWELEPNAFSELTQQYNQCDGVPCQCPAGRQFNSEDKSQTDFKIIRCGGCGASAVHMKCGNLSNFSFRCEVCRNVLTNINDVPEQEASDDEDEDELPRRRNSLRSRDIRINRRRFYSDSGSSDGGEPVYNILDRLPKVVVKDDCDAQDEIDSETTTSCSHSSSKKLHYKGVPKRQNIGGFRYELISAENDEESSSFLDEEDEEYEENEDEFKTKSLEAKVDWKGIATAYKKLTNNIQPIERTSNFGAPLSAALIANSKRCQPQSTIDYQTRNVGFNSSNYAPEIIILDDSDDENSSEQTSIIVSKPSSNFEQHHLSVNPDRHPLACSSKRVRESTINSLEASESKRPRVNRS